MKIECISQPPRKGGTTVSLPIAGTASRERTYHFRNPEIDTPGLSAERIKQLADEGPHVCEVVDEAHIAILLGVTEAFREWRAPLTPEEEAAEIARIRAEEEAAAAAAAEAKAKADAEEQARIDAEIAYNERVASAARALRDNQITAAEAEVARAGVPAVLAGPEEPSNPENAVDPLRAIQIAKFEADGAADRARAEAVRAAGAVSLAELRERYKTTFQRNPSPKWTAEDLIAKLAEG